MVLRDPALVEGLAGRRGGGGDGDGLLLLPDGLLLGDDGSEPLVVGEITGSSNNRGEDGVEEEAAQYQHQFTSIGAEEKLTAQDQTKGTFPPSPPPPPSD